MDSIASLLYHYRRMLALSLTANIALAIAVFAAGVFVTYEWVVSHPSSLPLSARMAPAASQTAAPIVVAPDDQSVIGVVKRANDAVFSIQVNDTSQDYGGWFFGPFDPQQSSAGASGAGGVRGSVEVGEGTGFFVTPDGYLVTNKHVVAAGSTFTAVLASGSRYPIKIVYIDPQQDIAIGKIEATDLPHLALGDSNDLQVGQSVVAIGDALAQYQNSVSTGIVSGLGRTIVAGDMLGDSEELDKVIQIDAAIYPGNSGGPLLDLSGRVVGVTLARAAGSEDIGFALPIDLVKDALAAAHVQTR